MKSTLLPRGLDARRFSEPPLDLADVTFCSLSNDLAVYYVKKAWSIFWTPHQPPQDQKKQCGSILMTISGPGEMTIVTGEGVEARNVDRVGAELRERTKETKLETTSKVLHDLQLFT